MARFVVDTHTLLWFFTADARLGNNAKNALLDAESDLIVPAVALAEALWIVGKLNNPIGPADVLTAIDADARITVTPLTREIVEHAHSLSAISEMHDRQIAATAMMLDGGGGPVTLLTKDADIVASGLVATAW